MKKIASVFLVVSLIATMASCINNASNNDSTSVDVSVDVDFITDNTLEIISDQETISEQHTDFKSEEQVEETTRMEFYLEDMSSATTEEKEEENEEKKKTEEREKERPIETKAEHNYTETHTPEASQQIPETELKQEPTETKQDNTVTEKIGFDGPTDTIGDEIVLPMVKF